MGQVVGRRLTSRLSFRVPALILVAVLPAFLALGGVVYYRVQEDRARAGEGLLEAARELANQNGVLLGQAHHLLAALVSLPAVRQFPEDNQRCARVMGEVLKGNPRYAYLGVVDAKGLVVCPGLAVPPGISVADRSWFKRVMASRDFAVGDFAVGRGSGRRSIHLAYPVRASDGTVIGAINAALDLEWLSQELLQISLPAGIEVMLLDQSGQVLAARPDHGFVGRDAPISAEIPISEQRSSGILEGQLPSGSEGLLAFTPLGGSQRGSVSVIAGRSRSAIDAGARRDLVFGLAGITITAVFAWLIASVAAHHLISRPISRLRTAVSKFAQGDLSVRVATAGGGDEVGELSFAFNTMADELQTRQRELAEAHDRAVDAGRAKSDFLATMSHELRTPLNAIMGFAELMLANVAGPLASPKQREYLCDIRESAEHLLNLISDILDLARIEAGRLALEEERVPLTAILESAVRFVQERAKEKDLKLVVRRDGLDGLPHVCVDPLRLKQALLNILVNAIKFTLPGGSVLVETVPTPSGGIEIAVKDTGIGMNAEEIPVALERFAQVDRTKHLRQEGAGLGLPIAKELVEMHGGSLQIESTKGIGTTARLCLPRERVVVEGKTS